MGICSSSPEHSQAPNTNTNNHHHHHHQQHESKGHQHATGLEALGISDWKNMPKELNDEFDVSVPIFDENEFVFLKGLGAGAFGKVVQVLRKQDKKMFALKIIDKKQICQRHGIDHVRRITLEREWMRKIQHPFFAGLEGEFRLGKRFVLFLMELCPFGSLRIIQEQMPMQKFSIDQAKLYAAQILSVIVHLHKENIVHRDLRPDNILIGGDGCVRLIDIGIAAEVPHELEGRFIEDEEEYQDVREKTRKVSNAKNIEEVGKDKTSLVKVVGATGWKPPEMQKHEGYDFTADFWNFGVILYIFLVGKHPFIHKGLFDLGDPDKSALIKAEKINFPKTIPDDAKDLIRRLCEPNPTRRLGTSQKDLLRTASGISIPNADPEKSEIKSSQRSHSKNQSTDSSFFSRLRSKSNASRDASHRDAESDNSFQVRSRGVSDARSEFEIKLTEEELKNRFPGDGLEIRKHPFFASIDWEMLQSKKVPMPKLESTVISQDDKPEFENFKAVLDDFERRDLTTNLENLMLV
jgi:serine/threonine protein kinase